MDPNEEIRIKIKKLIILLKKIRERDAGSSFMSDNDKALLQGLDFMINNFENVDIQTNFDINDIPLQFRIMLDPLINMLTEELGDDFDGNISNELTHLNETLQPDVKEEPSMLKAPSTADILDTIDDTIPMKHRIMMAIQQVDEMLKNVNPETELADDLLDKRIELLNKLKEVS